jgi:4-hydroxyproline epimerase
MAATLRVVHRIRYVDSHTEGEPTRVIVGGAPALQGATVAQKARSLAGRFQGIWSALVNEPRGSDIVVGAVLVPPDHPHSLAGVIFLNNTGVLGMCGHGTIGVVRTLAHMARLEPGELQLDTPVGTVTAVLTAHASGVAPAVHVHNVRSFVERTDLALTLPDGRTVHGDVAWGGNGFFLCSDHGVPVDMEHLDQLRHVSLQIRHALNQAGVTSVAGHPLDHVELLAPARHSGNHSRNYVLCPGGAYDRSPCGTGTSAKLACLAAKGELDPGEHWHQESVTGSVFHAWYQPAPEGGVLPVIQGRAWITAEGELLLEPSDPTLLPNGSP